MLSLLKGEIELYSKPISWTQLIFSPMCLSKLSS